MKLSLLIMVLVVTFCPILVSSRNYRTSLIGKPKISPIKETTSDQLTQDMLLYHKSIRAYHGVPGLELSDSLKEYARLRALLLAFYEGKDQRMADYLNLGENIWFQAGESESSASRAIKGWYFNQAKAWNYSEPKISEDTRNFAQVVWKDSTHIGCAQAYSALTNPGTYTICYYYPAGNVPDQAAVNVLAPKFASNKPVEKLVEETVKGLMA